MRCKQRILHSLSSTPSHEEDEVKGLQLGLNLMKEVEDLLEKMKTEEREVSNEICYMGIEICWHPIYIRPVGCENR